MARALRAPRPRRERNHPKEPRSAARLATRARTKRAARAAATRAVTAALERELVALRAPVTAREHPDPGLACLTLAFLAGALASTAVALALWARLPSAPDAPVLGRAPAAPVRPAAPPTVAQDVIVP